MFRGRMKAASTIFQNSAVDNVSIIIFGFLQLKMRLPSTPMLKEEGHRCSEWSWLIPAHDADFNQTLTFALPIYFLPSIAGISFSLRLCQRANYSLHIQVPTRGPSQVFVPAECRELYSLLRVVPACIVLSIFPNEEEGRVHLRREFTKREEQLNLSWKSESISEVLINKA